MIKALLFEILYDKVGITWAYKIRVIYADLHVHANARYFNVVIATLKLLICAQSSLIYV